MKTSLLFPLPLLAIALIAAGCSDRTQTQEATDSTSPTLSERADGAVEKTKEVATDTKDAISAKLNEWNLTPSDIKDDLAKSGRVVRDKTLAAGETVGGALDNARLVTVINGKYVADSDLSALKIDVDASEGVVTLKGTATSADLIGRAVALALHTDGVSQVISLLTIETEDDDSGM
ncbi:MAG: BON domain-containing protein [Verrucomicrobiota bacterium]